MNTTASIHSNNVSEISRWFDNFVSTLRSDQVQLESGVASPEKIKMYKPLLDNDYLNVARQSKELSNRILITELVTDFLKGLNDVDCQLLSLAFQLSDSKILAWAIVEDDDETSIDKIFMQEAKVNAKFSEYGLHISSTIMEQSDNYPIPNQFHSVI